MDTTGLSQNPFFTSAEVPAWGTESEAEASCIGSIGYVLVSWIWALIWHMGLDPLKWIMAYAINDDGFRDRAAFNKQRQRPAVLDERHSLEEATVPGTGLCVGLGWWGGVCCVSLSQSSCCVLLGRSCVPSSFFSPLFWHTHLIITS